MQTNPDQNKFYRPIGPIRSAWNGFCGGVGMYAALVFGVFPAAVKLFERDESFFNIAKRQWATPAARSFNLLLGGMVGTIHGLAALNNWKVDREQTQALKADNAVMRGQLDQTAQVLNEVADRVNRSSGYAQREQQPGGFATRVAEEAAAKAEATPTIH